MNLRLIAIAASLALSTSAYAAIDPGSDQNFDRTLTVSDQPDLYVSTGSGNIRVHSGGAGQIHIVGHVHAGWSAFGDVDGRVTKIVENPPITQSGNAIHVGESTNHSLFNNISIDYEITVPVTVALNLKSGSGDVEVDHVGRFLSAASGSGSVRVHGLKGPADLGSGSGDIELEDEAHGDVKAHTGSGSIRVHGFEGSLNARTGSGDIEGDGNLQGAAMVTSGSGSVRLHLAAATRFNLEATTGSGDIRVRFPNAPQQDEHSRHHLTAPINGGGPPLEVHTGSGDIEIAPR
jgi:DUF4097 and DUF4098 domain-containing protein YvlB